MRRAVLAAAMLLAAACSADGAKRTARTVLDVAQITCVLVTSLTDDRAVADACGIADDLAPELRKLLAARAAARAADGGAP